jgi:RimJ/RimL family protein N-acetyltransferase
LRVRRAEAGDVDFLVGLLNHEEVEPYLSARRERDHDGVLGLIERSEREPEDYGLFVIEVDGRLAGTMSFEVENRRSRIARLGGLALHPEFRGRGVGDEGARELQRMLFDELGIHRLELEIYAFNERAIRHAERVGFVREGVKRKAYWRRDDWVDGLLYAMLPEDR